jgi:hypothetical protein
VDGAQDVWITNPTLAVTGGGGGGGVTPITPTVVNVVNLDPSGSGGILTTLTDASIKIVAIQLTVSPIIASFPITGVKRDGIVAVDNATLNSDLLFAWGYPQYNAAPNPAPVYYLNQVFPNPLDLRAMLGGTVAGIELDSAVGSNTHSFWNMTLWYV